MRASTSLSFRIVAGALCLMLALFVVLSADVIVRVWLLRGQLESAVDAAVLLSYEAARTLTTGLALWLALSSWRRAGDASGRLLTLLVLFLGLWYTKAFAYAGFPGYLQERLARMVFAAGAPRPVMAFLFGKPVWAAWLALGALLRLSTIFPTPLDVDAIERSGTRDRTGLLRGVHLAGLDVGALFRRASIGLARHGGFGAAPVWVATAAAGTLHALATGAAAKAIFGALWVTLLMVAVTNLRATTAATAEPGRRRVLWLLQSSIVALAAFATSAILSVAGGRLASGISFGLAALAPPVILMGFALAITRREPPSPAPAVRRTLTLGLGVMAAAAAYILSAGLVTGRASPSVVTLVGLASAVACLLLLRPGIRRIVGRIDGGVAAST